MRFHVWDMSHIPLLAAGRRIGSFVVLRLIGRGGYSEVYEVEDGEGERAALKAARIHDAEDALASRRQLLEALVLRELAHPNVVRYLASGTTSDGISFTAMELVSGESLYQLLEREGRLGLDRAMRIGVQLAAGLAHAHELGTVHRDVKPANILVTGQGQTERVKLIDFGIAKLDCMPLFTTEIIGTPLYMAPDYLLARNPTRGDPRWDVYAAALVLYELITGRHPLLQPDEEVAPPVSVIVSRHLRTPIPPLGPEHGCPPELWSVLARSLARNPDERYPSARELESALSATWRELKMRRDGFHIDDGTLFGDMRGPATKKAVSVAIDAALDSVRYPHQLAAKRRPSNVATERGIAAIVAPIAQAVVVASAEQRQLGELLASDLDLGPPARTSAPAALSRPGQRHASDGRSMAAAQVSIALPERAEHLTFKLDKVQIRPAAMGLDANGELQVRLPGADARAVTAKGLERGADAVLASVAGAPPSSRRHHGAGSTQGEPSGEAWGETSGETWGEASGEAWGDGARKMRAADWPWRRPAAEANEMPRELGPGAAGDGLPTFRPSMVDPEEAARLPRRRATTAWLAVAGVVVGGLGFAAVRTATSSSSVASQQSAASSARLGGPALSAAAAGRPGVNAEPSGRLRSEPVEPAGSVDADGGGGDGAGDEPPADRASGSIGPGSDARPIGGPGGAAASTVGKQTLGVKPGGGTGAQRQGGAGSKRLIGNANDSGIGDANGK
ncbi:MAG: serine/threonine protein kinase [Myxococcales bacterium]|nr:serine/threonine protein kinase [Myxococcales bacterium]